MRILFLCRPYIHTTIGGIPEFLNNLLPELQNLGLNITFYTQSENKKDFTLYGPEKWHSVPYYHGPFLKPRFFIRKKELQPLLQLCKDLDIQLIHSQGIYRCGFMANAIRKATGIPYVITSHSDILAANSDRMNKAHILRRTHKIMDDAAHVTHLTPFMAEAAHAVFDTRNKSTLIGNGINTSQWHNFIGLPEKNYMLAIGRLEKTKGFHILIDAYAQLQRQTGTATSLVIAGSGKYEHDLHAQARALGLNVITDCKDLSTIPPASIIFTGYITGNMKKELYGHATFVLFAPQWEEPFGIVQLEAMAAGKALIASDGIATRYLQAQGLPSLLVKANDVSAWTETMALLLNHPERCKELGKLNLNAAKQFAWQTIAEQYKQVYRTVLKLT